MAKTSWINRNERKRATVKKYAALRAELKAKKDYAGLTQLPRDASPTRVVNRCEVTGRRRAFIRRFKISRLTFRELASSRLDSWRNQVELVNFVAWARRCAAREPAGHKPAAARIWMNFPSIVFSAPIADVVAQHWDPLIILIAKLATVGALVALNGFFVVAEFALVKIRDSQLKTLADEGVTRAALVKTD